MVTVRVPASSANLGPGFDALGMALGLHLEAGLVDASTGAGAPRVDEHHLVMRAFRAAGGAGEVWVRSPIPMGRGLGFSGAARIAGLVLAVVQHHGDLDPGRDAGQLLAAATELEGHADNVAASLHGGVVATAAGLAVQIPLRLDPMVVCWVPSQKTLTDESRLKVVRPLAFDEAVFNIGRTALLVAALAAGDVAALRAATQDRLHQEVRLRALPASRAALAGALRAGAWCGWLSGSGPTVAMLCDRNRADDVANALPPGGSVKVLRIDHEGVCVAPSP